MEQFARVFLFYLNIVYENILNIGNFVKYLKYSIQYSVSMFEANFPSSFILLIVPIKIYRFHKIFKV